MLANTNGLTRSQIEGMAAGLTYEQVNHAWFIRPHARAAQSGIPYAEYQGLGHNVVAYGINKGFSRAQVEGLNLKQIEGIAAGLTREQVNHDWFTHPHVRAAQAGIPYTEYQGLDYVAVAFGINEGLTRVQVEGLNHEQIKFVKQYSLPNADIVKGLTGEELAIKVKNYCRLRERTAFASVFSPCNGALRTLKLPHDLVEKIGKFI